MRKPSAYLKRLRSEQQPVRFILSRLLWFSGQSSRLIINRKGLYFIHFDPAYLPAQLWAYPDRLTVEEQFMVDYLRPGDIVVDVGANIGSTTLASASIVGKTGKVIAIEAHPRIFGFMKKNIALNNCDNVILYNQAVGNEVGTVRFSDKTSDVTNRVVQTGGISVPLNLLDNLLDAAATTRIALLKVDVEGYEKYVFEGARQTLARADCVFFEQAGHYTEYGYDNNELFQILNEFGFQIYQVQNLVNNCVAVRDPELLRNRLTQRTFSQIA